MGYSGNDFSQKLRENDIECEYSDPDYTVLMLTPENSKSDLEKIKSAFLNIPKLKPIKSQNLEFSLPKRALSLNQALFCESETICVQNALGRVVAGVTVSCPPAIPIIVSGEIISADTIKIMNYYGIKNIDVKKL